MKYELKEILIGILYGILTMLFMIGMLPWDLVSKLIGCIIAMFAVWRIKNKMRDGVAAAPFTVSFMAVVIIITLLLSLTVPI